MKSLYLSSQQAALYQLLSNDQTANTFDIQRIGIRNPSQVIRQLINKGAVITTYRKSAFDHFGYSHNRITFYTFKGFRNGN
jgi:hypothetical protein